MATEPFSDELVAKLKQATAWRFNTRLGTVFTPRFFCCTDPNEMGVVDGKQPVAVLEMTPNPSFPGDNVTFDGQDSYDPDGSVASQFFTFEDGTPSSSTSSNGTVSWAAAGEYEVTLVVTDGTGQKSSPARVIQRVVEPAEAFFIGTSNGVFFTDDGGQSWVAKNNGLSGDALVVHDLKIDPATQNLGQDAKTLWIATDGGIYVSNDGGGSWAQKNPAGVSNQWGDSPAPTIDDVAFRALRFAGDKLFVAGTWLNGSDYRSWAWHTEDAATMRTDTGQAVAWTQLTTGWSS
jgi:hypothetical protein